MTAQDIDLRAFTDADYNSLRSSIYSPDKDPTIEVNLFNICINKLSLIYIIG
jgi:hypothetical protein